MVLLHVKRGDESQFLLQAPGSTELEELTVQVARVYNARLKVQRVCSAPNEKMKQVLKKTIEEAKAIISKKQVEAGVCVTLEMARDALDQLRGAVMIVYPMGLPPYDPIRMEFEDKEDLSGTQAGLSVIQESEAQLWWAAKELRRAKKLSDYVGKNEKTKIIAKIQQRGQGAPAREPIISSEEQKQLMLHYHRRQEELKVLLRGSPELASGAPPRPPPEAGERGRGCRTGVRASCFCFQRLEENADDDSCLNSPWADNTALKRHFHGVKDIKWRPR
ncbi:Cilia- and flagella-associated protein 298 [Galemys pyrenaicus]|uniref:Cilia- and flagella-associated protein 298 n=1 Tax=Galemys pyrenaicus TaxID=202257 RepID=A0A8J6AD22_GALPY|nr:Cilia- and flagella-associated protein 298 [Galemys pyrenaicus]